jgi:RNA polymerase sigma factor (TIGR02999 family)
MVRDDRQQDAPGDETASQSPDPEHVPLSSAAGDVTRILSEIEHGDGHAAEELLPLVYDELRKLAAAKMAQEASGQTLQATALVHEAYIRLVDVEKAQHWDSRGHFFVAAAEAMRRILVENARRKGREKRGGNLERYSLDDIDIAIPVKPAEALAIDGALEGLEVRNELAAKLVKLRYFAGFTIDEAAKAIGISVRKTNDLWTYARTWLFTEIGQS